MMRWCVRYLRLRPMRLSAWRMLYIPTCVFMVGLLYIHMMLVDSMLPKYYFIDGMSDGRSTLVQTTWTQPQWEHVQHITRHHGVLTAIGNKSRSGKIFGKHYEDNRSSTKVLSGQLGHGPLIALNGTENGTKTSEHTVPILKGSQNKKINDSAANMIKHINTLSKIASPVTEGDGVPLLKSWERKTVQVCGGRFVGYSGYIVQLKKVLVIHSLAKAEASGGEDIMSVTNHSESSESYTFTPGFFMLPCPEGILRSKFQPDKHKGYIKSWYDALVFDGPNFPEPATPKPAKVPKPKPKKNIPTKNKPTNVGQVTSKPMNSKLSNNKAKNKSSNDKVLTKYLPNNNRTNNNKLNHSVPNVNNSNNLGRKLLGLIIKGEYNTSNGNTTTVVHILENNADNTKVIKANMTDRLQVSDKKQRSRVPAQTKKKSTKPINLTELVPPGSEVMDDHFTIAITRYEYANLYWALVDIYDCFLTLTHFGHTPQTTQILFLDAKPRSHMDPLWWNFFGGVTRLAELPRAVRFNQMVWTFQRVHSPMLERKPLLLANNFRTQMLGAFNVTMPLGYSGGRYGKNCSLVGARRLNILFVWRHNYVAHPRNPSGVVSRKIANEAELLNATIKAFPRYNVRGEQLDKLDMGNQVKIISDTDLLIGMHGAAFAFAWFLPKGSGALEMFPSKGGSNWHMRHIAESNGVHYDTWKNKNPKNEFARSKSTNIPPDVVVGLIRDMVETICTNKTKVKKPPPKPPANIKKQKQQVQNKKPVPARPSEAKHNGKVSKVNNDVKHQAKPIPRDERIVKKGAMSKKKTQPAITPKPIGLKMPH